MCLSYQGASGVYIVFTLFCAFRMWKKNEIKTSAVIQFCVISALCYLVTLGLFKLLFVEKIADDIYVSTSTSASSIISNVRQYVSVLWNDFGHSSVKIFMCAAAVVFVIQQTAVSFRNKFASVFCAVLLLALSAVLSYGAYLALSRPLLAPRAYMGFCSFACCILLSVISDSGTHIKPLSFISNACCFICLYSFYVFAFTYGNVQKYQSEYADFRAHLLINNLKTVLPQNGSAVELHFSNDIGIAPAVQNAAAVYPVIKSGFIAGYLSSDDRSSQYVLFSYGLGTLKEGTSENKQNMALYPVVSEDCYTKIQASDSKYLITFKTPDFKVIK